MAAWRLIAVIAGRAVARAPDGVAAGRPRARAAPCSARRSSARPPSAPASSFTLLGPAGVGKSRLVAELASTIDDEATVLLGRCLPYGEGITFWPIVEVVKRAAGITPRLTTAEVEERLRAVVHADRRGGEIAERLGALLGAGEIARLERGHVLGGAQAARGGRARPAARGRARRRPLGRGDLPRPRRARRRLDPRRADPDRLPRAPGAARGAPELGRRQAQRDLRAARAARRRRRAAG